MGVGLAAPAAGDPPCLVELQAEIEACARSLDHPVVWEDGVELFDLTAADWRLNLEYGKLIFAVWDSKRSIVRRLEAVADRDPARIELVARRQGNPSTTRLELRERGWVEPSVAARAPFDRSRFRQELVGMLEREFPGWRLERVSQRSDREHSFSAWYTRGWARQGATAWAFLGLGGGEGPAAADGILAFGLIWLDGLRRRSPEVSVPGLKLFLPPEAVEATAHRAAYIDPRAVALEIFEWSPESQGRQLESPRRIDLLDYGNVETRLVPQRRREAVAASHRALVQALLGNLADRVDVVADAAGTFLSLRVLGLEVARVEGDATPSVTIEGGGELRLDGEAGRTDFRSLVDRAVRVRCARSEDPAHELYRAQGERWLESLLVRDLTRLDPALSARHVYPQVPAFSGPPSSVMHRGVIDILGVARSDLSGVRNRLAVIELKLYEEINLPLQGLDYWLRVKWLHERGQFKQVGYFPGVELAPEPPLLYLVSPAFRFHSTTDRLIGYLAPEVEIVKVGINHGWRERVKMLFRRPLEPGARVNGPLESALVESRLLTTNP